MERYVQDFGLISAVALTAYRINPYIVSFVVITTAYVLTTIALLINFTLSFLESQVFFSESSEKVLDGGRARCPTYEKSITYIPVGRAPSPARGVFQSSLSRSFAICLYSSPRQGFRKLLN